MGVRFLVGDIVSGCGPGCENEHQPRVLETVQRVALARLEGHERSGFAFDGLPIALHRDAAGDHLDERALADLMVGKLLAASKVEDDDPTFRCREQDPRPLLARRRCTWCVGARLARIALARRPGN